MKNKFILLVVLFFIFPFYVNAASYNEHIYMIEKFDINGDSITIGGYSFISHRDNYGGKNLSTYIIIHNNKWDGGSCNSDNPNCYRIKTNSVDRSFWASRCTKNACNYEQDVIKDVEVGNYVDTSVCNETDTNSITRTLKSGKAGTKLNGSSCLYYKVGFITTIDLNNVFNKFLVNNGESININEAVNSLNFKIESVIDSKDNEYDKTVRSEMGLYSGLCTKNNGTEHCGTGEILTNNFSINLGNMSNIAYYDATLTNAKLYNDDTNIILDAKTEDGNSKKFAAEYECDGEKCDYTILGLSKEKTNFTTKGLEFSAYAFELQTYYDIKKGDGAISVFPQPGPNRVSKPYWTSSDRIRVEGNLTISSLKKRVTTVSCEQIFGNSDSAPKNIICGNSANYKQCEVQKTVIGHIYYPTSKDCTYVGKVLIDENAKVVKVGTTDGDINFYAEKYKNLPAYIKINVVADVLTNQTATFSFGSVSPSEVYAGKGFSLGKTTYNNTINWVNVNYTYGNNPYYKYGDNWTFNGDQSNPSCYSVPLDLSGGNASKVYYEDIDGKLVGPININDAFYEAINVAVMKRIKTENVNKILLKSCDSNNSSGCDKNNPNSDVSGSWVKVDSSVNKYTEKGTLGKTIINNYEYKLSDSYVQVAGNDAGLVKYKDEVNNITENLKATGKKFYIDFKWNYHYQYPFNLDKDINPSFLSKMEWKLNGTCLINVRQGYYKWDEGGGEPDLNIKYRSIDVVNPFPKGIEAIKASNWISWYEKKGGTGITRINKTYENEPSYEITLSKYGGDRMVKISDVNNYSSNKHYKDISNIEPNGISEFVDKYFSKKVTLGEKGYCSLGMFNDNCDCDVRW